jgi:hypothetical protein
MANERLRTALLQRGLTPSDLADTVGVDPKTIERWDNRVAKVLGQRHGLDAGLIIKPP